MRHPSNRARDERNDQIRTLETSIAKLIAELEAENAKPVVDLERIGELGKRARRFQNMLGQLKPKAKPADGRTQKEKLENDDPYILKGAWDFDEHYALRQAKRRKVDPADEDAMAVIRRQIAKEFADHEALLASPAHQAHLKTRFTHGLPGDEV